VQRLDPARDKGSRLGTGHPRVALAIQVVVDGTGAAGGEVAAEHRPEHGGEREAVGIGDDHRRDRRDQQQRDDPRLGQGDVVPDVCEQRRGGGAATGGDEAWRLCGGAFHQATTASARRTGWERGAGTGMRVVQA
jgi:hypothetical protein